MISMIILGVLGFLAIIGLGKTVLKDFRIGAILAMLFCGAVIGLNLIPTITWGSFQFTVGTMLFYVAVIALFFVYGRFMTQMTALSIALILGGLAYAATRLALLGTGGFFAETNPVYAVVIGILAFIFTRNGKYTFLVSAGAMLILNMLVQIGADTYSLSHGFDWTLVAVATSTILYGITARAAVKPSKMSYYFEAGRLED